MHCHLDSMESLLQTSQKESVEKDLKRPSFREIGIVLLLNFVICSVVAVFIWVGVDNIGRHGLFSSWVYSQCIGQSICIGFIMMFYRRRIHPDDLGIGYYLFYPIIVIAGFFIGLNLARLLLSHPTIPIYTGTAFLTMLLITSGVSIFSIWFFNSRQRVASLKAEAAEEAARASDAKLSMLQAQIEPHMLFNTLSNLRSLIDNDPEKAKVMLDHLVDFLRATLTGSQQQVTTLEEEFKLLDNYLSLMSIRMGERLYFELHLPRELRPIVLPTLLLQPVVENAIKHGLEPTISGGQVSVRALTDQGWVVIEIVDTGAGCNTEDLSTSGGFGLQSVRDRLTVTGEKEPIEIASPLKNGDPGTLVTLRLPKHSELTSDGERL